MYLLFDTETTGIPRRWNAPVEDLSNWPRVVQIAWVVCDARSSLLSAQSFLVRPDGFTIPKDATRVHGITTARARRDGVPLSAALEAFAASAKAASVAVAHNVDFDENVIGAECLRLGIASPLKKLRRICTMKTSTEYCGIRGPYGFKWPSLEELHQVLFGEPPENLHDASSDVRACARCFFELKRREVLR